MSVRNRTPEAGRVSASLCLLQVLGALALACSIGLGSGEARAIWPFDAPDTQESLGDRAAEILAESIRARTVNPPGNEAALARKLAARLDRAGIENGIIATPSPEGGPARAAVWGRLRGQGTRPGLALLSHLDTVPANAEDWSVDPYAGTIAEGYVWGRGALDSKGVAITHLMTLIALAESGTKLERDLVFLSTPEEETGGRLGAGWLAAHHPELLEGIGYLLTEGGGIQAAGGIEKSRPAVWGVTLTEKAPCWLELRSKGQAGHSAAPRPDAAVPRLIAALDKIRRVESPVRVGREVSQMFEALAPLAADWNRAGYTDLAAALQKDEAFRRRFLDDPGQNALVRNTISITVLEGAPKTNIAPALARAQLDARLLPGESCEAFRADLEALIDEPSIEIQEILSFPARASSAQTPLYRAIERVAATQQPGGLVVPRMIAGFTDAHWFRELGIVAYGFVPRELSGEEARRVHGTDERISIDGLTRSIELSLEIVRAFDEVEAAPEPEAADPPAAGDPAS